MTLLTLAATFVVVFGPGLAATYALGLRGLAAWALAPALTCTVVGFGGVLAHRAGLTWHAWLLLALTLVAAVVAAGVGRLLPSRGARRPDQPGQPGQRDAADPSHRWWTLGGVAVGAAVVLAGFLRSMGSLSAVPAQPDATYHLNSIRDMLQTGNISSLTGGSFLYERPSSFYPSTFHGLAATVGQLVHVQPVVLANCLALVSAAGVWVTGCLLLTRQVFGRTPGGAVFTGLAAAGFSAFPYWMGGYGTLWPYLLGVALVPALMACVLCGLRLARVRATGEPELDRPRALVALLAGLAGLPLVHPDALAALALVGYVMVVVAVVQRLTRPRVDRAVVVRGLGAVVLPLLAWWAAGRSSHMRAMSHNYARGPDQHLPRAIAETLVSAPRYGTPLWVTSAVMVLGLLACTTRAVTRWVSAAYVVLALVFVGVAAVQSGLTRAITVYWYNDPPRLGAMLALAGVPAVTAGLLALTALVRNTVLRGENARGAAALAVGLLFVVATLGDNHGAAVGRMRPYYSPSDPLRALLPASAPSAFVQLARSIPPDAVVAENPWRGNALLYAFTSRRVAFYSEKALSTTDRVLLATDLDQAGAPGRSDVCAAIKSLGVTYVLTGGTNELRITGHRNPFAGIDRVPGSPGFVQVATAGGYTVWRVTACAGASS